MKFLRSLAMAFNLIMARTFGRYIHTIGGPDHPLVAIYEWRKRRWAFQAYKDETP